MRVQKPDSSQSWLSVNSQPLFHPGQTTPSAVVVSFADITEHKLVEQALRESEERFALAMQGTSDGLWDWNIINDKVYYSAQFKALLGYRSTEFSHMFET